MKNLPKLPGDPFPHHDIHMPCLVIGDIRSQAASLPQLKTFFQRSGILLLSLTEIEETDPLVAWTTETLPDPQQAKESGMKVIDW